MENDLRYPIGKFLRPAAVTAVSRAAAIKQLELAPAELRAAVEDLSPEQLDTPYREGGWTVRQVVHHVADSHMHSYARAKFLVSEDNPVIKPYDEQAWAQYDDGAHEDVEVSLTLLESLHTRYVRFLRSLPETAFARTLVHPVNGPMTLDVLVELYAWHGRHHTAHITELRRRMGW